MSNPATNPRLLSPNGFHVQKYTLDPSVRYIVLYGGSSSAKSFSVAQVLAMRSYYERSSTLVMRKVGASIERTIYSDFRAAIKGIKGFSDVSTFKQNSIVFKGGGKIDFSGLDDPEKIKGISQYKRVFLDELSEYTESDFKQIRLRLRGQEGQQILAAFNPISEEHWIKKKWFDKEKWHEVPMLVDGIKPELCKVKSVRMNETKYIPNPITGEYDEHAPDTVIIQSTYLNNFWVVGSPDGKYGYYDYQTIANFERDRINDPDYYQVYALGEWGHIRTGAEFFPSFNRGVVCGDFSYNPELPLHLCMDSNVLPYVTATFFQKEYKPDDYQQVTQVGELPIESPNNSARKAANVIAAKLREWKYDDKLYLHGDASGKAANTIDPNNRSFFDLVIDELEKEGYEVVDCISGKNPSVSTTGEFINAIWDGLILKVALCVDNNCKTSIDDYQAVQKDENGAILKTKVTDPVTKRKYEQHGHISDCLRYVCYDLLRAQYTEFSMGRKRSYIAEGDIKFFNPSATYKYERTEFYFSPNVSGKFVAAHIGRVGGNWHLLDACYSPAIGNDEVKNIVTGHAADEYIAECQSAYFPLVRELRDLLSQVSVMKANGDPRVRISAMNDWVKSNIHINPEKMSGQYADFVNAVLDYSDATPPDSIGPSMALSGLARVIMRNML